jgi:hypothetical protein
VRKLLKAQGLLIGKRISKLFRRNSDWLNSSDWFDRFSHYNYTDLINTHSTWY